MDEQINGWIDGWILNRWMDMQMNRHDGWMDRQIDKWIDGQIMDRQMNRCINELT